MPQSPVSPVGLAAAAAIISSRKGATAKRDRGTERILTILRENIDELSIKINKEAIVLVAQPGKKNDTFEVFGSKVLKEIVKNLNETIINELRNAALSHQAPDMSHMHSNVDMPPPQPSPRQQYSPRTAVTQEPAQSAHSYDLRKPAHSHGLQEPATHSAHQSLQASPPLFDLPLLKMNGVPTPVEAMTLDQLKLLIPELVRRSTGRERPGWGKEATRPPWWPAEVPWTSIVQDKRSQKERRKLLWTDALRRIVINCYKFHGREDLLRGYSSTSNASLVAPFELPELIFKETPTPVKNMTLSQLKAFIPLLVKQSTRRDDIGWGDKAKKPAWWPEDIPWANIKNDTRKKDEKNKVNLQQLKLLIPELVRRSTGRERPGWGKEATRPPWWPAEVPWTSIVQDKRSQKERRKLLWTDALRRIIINCYKFHGRTDLLPEFSEDPEDEAVTRSNINLRSGKAHGSTMDTIQTIKDGGSQGAVTGAVVDPDSVSGNSKANAETTANDVVALTRSMEDLQLKVKQLQQGHVCKCKDVVAEGEFRDRLFHLEKAVELLKSKLRSGNADGRSGNADGGSQGVAPFSVADDDSLYRQFRRGYYSHDKGFITESYRKTLSAAEMNAAVPLEDFTDDDDENEE